MQSEDSYTSCHKCHDTVLVKRILATEESNVQSHDRKELARLGQDEGYVVDMLERCIAKGRSQGRCDGHQEHRKDDAAAGEDG